MPAYKSRVLCCHKPALQQFLVPPTSHKDYDSRVLAGIWRTARERLAAADRVTFIGYSMPNEDTKVRTLFRNAMYDRGGKPWRGVEVVGPSARELLGNFKEVFPNARSVQKTAREFVRSLR